MGGLPLVLVLVLVLESRQMWAFSWLLSCWPGGGELPRMGATRGRNRAGQAEGGRGGANL